MSVTGIVIPADEQQPIYKYEFSGELHEYQQIVGGLIEPLDVPDATIWMNEEGHLEGLPMNLRATDLLYEAAPAWRGFAIIVGDAYVTGQADDEGDTMSVPDEYLAKFNL